MNRLKIFILIVICYSSLFNKALSFEIIRDVELENFTKKIVTSLVRDSEINLDEINYYFIKSKEVNAFVTSGNNLFINTEILISSNDYREYAAVLAHELAHILGGHVFRTKQEINNLGSRAFPIYVLGILGILGGSADAGMATLMVGSASVQDGYTYYSRNQEASADQAAVKLLCNNKIDGRYLIEFLNKLEKSIPYSPEQTSYRSTHPTISERTTWIESSLRNKNNDCRFNQNKNLQNEFLFLKAKLFGFTHSNDETYAVYQSDKDIDKYAKAVASYLSGNHNDSIDLLKQLIDNNPKNPFFKELIGEIYFSKHNYELAIKNQHDSIRLLNEESDLYYMMIGNYYLANTDETDHPGSIEFLRKSLRLNPKNTYSWYLLAKAYAETGNLHLAEYATAERYFLTGNYGMAREFAVKSLKNIEKNTTEWYRANDLLNIISNMQNQDS